MIFLHILSQPSLSRYTTLASIHNAKTRQHSIISAALYHISCIIKYFKYIKPMLPALQRCKKHVCGQFKEYLMVSSFNWFFAYDICITRLPHHIILMVIAFLPNKCILDNFKLEGRSKEKTLHHIKYVDNKKICRK